MTTTKNEKAAPAAVDGVAWTRPTDFVLPRALELLDVDTLTGKLR